MADRLVDGQPEVRRIENQIVLAGLDAPGLDLLGGKRRPQARVARHIQRLDVFPAGAARRELVLVHLELAVVADRGRGERRADANQRLGDVGAFGRHQRLDFTKQRQRGAGEADGRYFERRFVGGEEQRDLLLERHLDRVAANRRHPGAGHRLDRRELDAVPANDARRPGHGHGIGCRTLRALAGHRAGGGEPPAPVDQGPDAQPVGFAVADARDLAFTGRDRLAAVASDPRVGVRRAPLPRRVQRFVGDFQRCGIRRRSSPGLCERLEGERPYAATAAALAAVVLMKSRRVGDMFYPRGFAPRTPPHALSRAASPARSVRVARSRARSRRSSWFVR